MSFDEPEAESTPSTSTFTGFKASHEMLKDDPRLLAAQNNKDDRELKSEVPDWVSGDQENAKKRRVLDDDEEEGTKKRKTEEGEKGGLKEIRKKKEIEKGISER
jgi:hypothetical protein